MNRASESRYASFLVRFWREAGDPGAGDEAVTSRGWVQHVPSGESTYFHRLADLLAFMERWVGALPLGDAPPRPAPEPGSTDDGAQGRSSG